MTAHVIVGGQYGSEAKGHVAAQVALRLRETASVVACARVGGPNAGHSVQDATGRVFAFRTIPVTAPLFDDPVVITAGSEIEISVLVSEILMLEEAGYHVRGRLFIDNQATILTAADHATESAGEFRSRFGSTSKGIGAARMNRLARTAELAKDHAAELRPFGVLMDTAPQLNLLAMTAAVVIEGTQGYGLGLHAGHYPFCTSGDCRSIDFLAQAGISPHVPTKTWITYRTFPIRVAGNSGPMYYETDWGYLEEHSDGYIKPELTTVTKLTRRVGFWDPDLAKRALAANGGAGNPDVHTVLTFIDYIDPALAGCTRFDRLQASHAWKWVERAERELGHQFSMFTTGPGTAIWRPELQVL